MIKQQSHMEKTKTLYVRNRKEWRDWLKKNFDKEKEIWLVYPKKGTGKEKILYNDAVEEALCFGWIDSTMKTLDEENTMQRFTPRRAKSQYSQPNKERLKWLAEKGQIHPSVKPLVKDIINEKFMFPSDIIEALKKDKQVWNNFKNFSDSYKRIRIAYIDSARSRPEEFKKRLNNFIEKTRENKLIAGYGGVEKYY